MTEQTLGGTVTHARTPKKTTLFLPINLVYLLENSPKFISENAARASVVTSHSHGRVDALHNLRTNHELCYLTNKESPVLTLS